LDAGSQEILSGFLEARAGGDEIGPQTRVIATTSEDLGSLVETGRFHGPLARRLMAHTLKIPRLVDRKEDVLPLAEYFLSKCDARGQESAPTISKSAQHALRRLQCRRRNVAELREAVELAALIADGPELGPEHIFAGPKGRSHQSELDLAQSRPVRWLSHRVIANVLQTAILLLFLALTVLCLAAGDSLVGRIANGLVWGLWWPALLVLFLFVGRLWCPFCPVSKAGRLARTIGSLNLPPPSWLKRQSGWIMAILFFAIVWSEHVFHMPQTPVATGFLLLTLMTLSVVLCTVHAREVWCRYICPLGSLSAGYAVSSPIYVHANSSICASECKTHECYKGSASESGCPMFHHPLFVRDSHFCKVCLKCLRICPHQSARVYLRPPLQDIWRMEDLDVTLIPFCLVAFFLSIIMLASRKEGVGLSGAWEFTVAGCAAVAAAFVLSAAFPRLLSRQRDLTVASRIAFALLILAWGPFMAFHLANVPGLDALGIHFAAGSPWAERIPSLEVPLLEVLQIASISVAAILAGVAFWRIPVHAGGQGAQLILGGWRVVLALGAVYLAVAFYLVILGEAP
jgi:polyferredoxin